MWTNLQQHAFEHCQCCAKFCLQNPTPLKRFSVVKENLKLIVIYKPNNRNHELILLYPKLRLGDTCVHKGESDYVWGLEFGTTLVLSVTTACTQTKRSIKSVLTVYIHVAWPWIKPISDMITYKGDSNWKFENAGFAIFTSY